MVRNDEQSRRLRERLVSREKAGVHVAMGANEGQRPCFFVNLPRGFPDRRVGIEEAVVVQLELSGVGMSAVGSIRDWKLQCSFLKSSNLLAIRTN
jgi:hypothetical protein